MVPAVEHTNTLAAHGWDEHGLSGASRGAMKGAWIILIGVVACKGKEAADHSALQRTVRLPFRRWPPTKASVLSGELTISGAMAGTFHWTPDLNLTCTWIPDLKTGGLDIRRQDSPGVRGARRPGAHRRELHLRRTREPSPLKATTGFCPAATIVRACP